MDFISLDWALATTLDLNDEHEQYGLEGTGDFIQKLDCVKQHLIFRKNIKCRNTEMCVDNH